MSEERTQVSVGIDQTLLTWIEEEALKNRRSRTGQIEYMLAEQRRVVDHNRKAAQRQQPMNA